MSASTPIIWGIVGYYLVPKLFGGQSKRVQYAIMVALPLALWYKTYSFMKDSHKQMLKNKATALEKMRNAKAIVAQGPSTPGYQAALKITIHGISY